MPCVRSITHQHDLVVYDFPEIVNPSDLTYIKTRDKKQQTTPQANSPCSLSSILLPPAMLKEVEEENRLLPPEEEGEEKGRKRKGSWWSLDTVEAKVQVQFAVPMVLTNVSYYAIPMISVMFAGHLGDVELAGATLANSWASVTAFAFTVSRKSYM